jgi:hypothetical protein
MRLERAEGCVSYQRTSTLAFCSRPLSYLLSLSYPWFRYQVIPTQLSPLPPPEAFGFRDCFYYNLQWTWDKDHFLVKEVATCIQQHQHLSLDIYSAIIINNHIQKNALCTTVLDTCSAHSVEQQSDFFLANPSENY